MSALFYEINGSYYGVDGRWLGSSLNDCKVAGYLYSIGIEDNKPIDLAFAQYSGKYYLQNGSLIKSTKKCSCLDQTGSDKPGAQVYYRNYLDLNVDDALSVATVNNNPEEICKDPLEEPGFGDLRCGEVSNVLITDINCENYGSTIQCTSCAKRCDHCGDPINPCPGCEGWSSVGSQICFDTCENCCPYPELGCISSLKIFNSYQEVLNYFSSDSCSVGDNQKKQCSDTLEYVDGVWQCYDLTSECAPPVEITFTASNIDDFVIAEYSGTVVSSTGPINNGFAFATIGQGPVTMKAYVVPGGTAKIRLENTFSTGPARAIISISAQGNTVSEDYCCCSTGGLPCPGSATIPSPCNCPVSLDLLSLYVDPNI